MKTQDQRNYMPGQWLYLGHLIQARYIPGGRLGRGYTLYSVEGETVTFRRLKEAREYVRNVKAKNLTT